jgi:hypothetical protein
MPVHMLVHIPGINTSSKCSREVSHKAHSTTQSENEIYDNEKYGSFEIFVLFMFVEIIGIDCEKRHSEAASTNSRTF